jgi:DNA-binding XRE family transcriptional regulator
MKGVDLPAHARRVRHPGPVGGEQEFGELLAELRRQWGMRQIDLAEKLGIGRSTLANVERGRERPSPRLWHRIIETCPEWSSYLSDAYLTARGGLSAVTGDDLEDGAEPFVGGPFELVSVAYVYVFEESRSPGEIIEVRRVRATESRAGSFGLKLTHHGASGFVIDQHALWGGRLASSEHVAEDGNTVYWRQFDFDRRLRKGEVHEFALRSWVERDPDPQTAIQFSVTLPARVVSIHAAFHGSVRPAAAWSYGPLPDDLADEVPATEGTPIDLPDGRAFSSRFHRPELEMTYGVGWVWQP